MSFRNEAGEIIGFGVRALKGDMWFIYFNEAIKSPEYLAERVNQIYPIDSADKLIDDAATAISYKVTWQDRIDIRAHLLSELDKYI